MSKYESPYKGVIEREMTSLGYKGYDARHIEASIRLIHNSLGNMGLPMLQEEIKLGVAFVEDVGLEGAESCARSFGL